MEPKNASSAKIQFIREVLSGHAKNVISQSIWVALRSGFVNSTLEKKAKMLMMEEMTRTDMKSRKSLILMLVDS